MVHKYVVVVVYKNSIKKNIFLNGGWLFMFAQRHPSTRFFSVKVNLRSSIAFNLTHCSISGFLYKRIFTYQMFNFYFNLLISPAKI